MTDHELQLKAVALRRAEILTAKYTKYAKGEQSFGLSCSRISRDSRFISFLFLGSAWFAAQLPIDL
jgi:hypothetical protein